MKKILGILLLAVCTAGLAKEKVTLFYPYAASASSTPATLRLVDEANKIQQEIEFVLEFKPGGNQSIAVRSMEQAPSNGLALIAPAYIENFRSGLFDRNNHRPVWSMGNACWAVISNLGKTEGGVASLTGIQELVLGGVGFGNATHLTGIMLGERFKFKTRYIVFKANTDALVNLVANNGVNLAIDKAENFHSFKSRADIQVLGVSCPTRMDLLPGIKTLAEQGVNAPMVFNIVISHKDMSVERRNRIRSIFDRAAENIGSQNFMQLSGLRPTQFDNINPEDFYNRSINLFETLLTRYEKAINESKN
jgi:tripartite-type tricarboxylate transporter receptor subunit TctC